MLASSVLLSEGRSASGGNRALNGGDIDLAGSFRSIAMLSESATASGFFGSFAGVMQPLGDDRASVTFPASEPAFFWLDHFYAADR